MKKRREITSQPLIAPPSPVCRQHLSEPLRFLPSTTPIAPCRDTDKRGSSRCCTAGTTYHNWYNVPYNECERYAEGCGTERESDKSDDLTPNRATSLGSNVALYAKCNDASAKSTSLLSIRCKCNTSISAPVCAVVAGTMTTMLLDAVVSYGIADRRDMWGRLAPLGGASTPATSLQQTCRIICIVTKLATTPLTPPPCRRCTQSMRPGSPVRSACDHIRRQSWR